MSALPRHLFQAPNYTLEGAMTEAVCYWEALRRLGFSADDIHIALGRLSDERTGVRVELRSGGREFAIDVAAVVEDPPTVTQAWMKRAEAHNRGDYVRQWPAMWRKSAALQQAGALVVALAMKGFEVTGSLYE